MAHLEFLCNFVCQSSVSLAVVLCAYPHPYVELKSVKSFFTVTHTGPPLMPGMHQPRETREIPLGTLHTDQGNLSRKQLVLARNACH